MILTSISIIICDRLKIRKKNIKDEPDVIQ